MAIRKLLAAALVLACVSFNAAAKKSKAAEKEKAAPALEAADNSDASDNSDNAGASDSSDKDEALKKDGAEGKDAAASEAGGESNHSRYTISAIEAPEPGLNYYVTKDEKDNVKFVQKLSWNKISDIKHYHITIEKNSEAGWAPVLEKDLNENKIEVSLPAGNYRFQIGVVNLFDQLEKSSDWKFFEVLKATQPKIEAMQTDSLYLNSKKATGLFTLRGENLTESTIFTMEQRNSDPPKILYGRIASISPDGQSADVQFDLAEISEGKYEIYAQNPGGLSVISKSITIKNKKDRNWRIAFSAGYTLPMTFFDGTFNKYTKSNFYPISATARASLISFHTKYGNFGFGLNGNFTRFSADTENYSLGGYYANALLGALWQKYFIPEKLCLEARVGAGAAYMFGTRFTNKKFADFEIKSPEVKSLALAFGGGLGLQYHVGKHFYVEGAVDFVDALFGGMNLGMIYPSISVGGMF